MQILKKTGIDWPEKRLISKFSMDQRVKYHCTEGTQEVCRFEQEFDKDAVCREFCSNCTANASPMKLWMELETSASEGKLFKL